MIKIQSDKLNEFTKNFNYNIIYYIWIDNLEVVRRFFNYISQQDFLCSVIEDNTCVKNESNQHTKYCKFSTTCYTLLDFENLLAIIKENGGYVAYDESIPLTELTKTKE